jgi:hypothetical protein
MPKELSFNIQGLDKVAKILAGAGDRTPEAFATVLKNFADTQIVAPAKEKYVPVATGNLRSSIRSEGPTIEGSKITVSVVAGGPAAPYALKVHENPRAGKTGGVSPSGRPYPRTKGGKPTWATRGQWKYIETPAMLAAKSGQAWLAAEAKAVLVDMVLKG